MENNNKAKNRTIKMTDRQFNLIKQGAANRKLPMGKYLETVCKEFSSTCFEADPNLMCRLHTIRALLEIKDEKWNENMCELYRKNVEEICVLLKW